VATSPIVNKVVKIWCLSVSNLVQNFLVNDQFISVTCLLHDKSFSFASVYGANTYLTRRFLWRDLSFFTRPWCIMGDFNVVLSTDDCKGGWLLIRFLVMNSLTGLILMIFLVCLLLDLVILGVMEGEGCIEYIKDWIGLYVMECVWMNEILVLIRFLLKIVLIIPLFLLVILCGRLSIFVSFLCGFRTLRV